MAPQVIVYRYDGSPFATKIENLLALRNIPYARVNVPMVPPRKELLLLGIAYRRIPVVAIGNDVFCDTLMITQALERAFPGSDAHPSAFPARKDGGKVDVVLQTHFSFGYSEKSLFALGTQSIPWTKVPPALSQDRFGNMIGGQVPPPGFFEKLEARVPITRSALSTHLDYIEEQLSDGRQWLFDTAAPGYADVAAHTVFSWMRGFKSVREVFAKGVFPRAVTWLDALDAVISQRRKALSVQTVMADDAAARILSGSPSATHAVGWDEREAGRLGLARGVRVEVTPDDTGKVPTTGTLLGLTRREILLEIEPPNQSGKKLAVHFPRLGFNVSVPKTKGDKAKL
ncbi:hypothetical protein AURDEDRAFT_187138 [Auricularia subglabra TFB-10046 SS5]|uniref:GST N-terminal domain-containing protein n=1 Tax=Auricularia subglabra (strain TFB-10046 / SS5) TaxID=717982 RepID=J0LJN3_AURST|nr:hypothetical protein AURDEDRAFT_187138 [Auricularia subglabra TFB-10046 SS5]